MKKIRPMKAIREFCYDCCLKQWNEVALCPADNCPIWPFRKGKRKEARKTCPYTATQAIKLKCKDCSGYEPPEYKFCGFTDCSLWSFVKSRQKALETGKIEPKEAIKLFEGVKRPTDRRPLAFDSTSKSGL